MSETFKVQYISNNNKNRKERKKENDKNGRNLTEQWKQTTSKNIHTIRKSV